MYIPSFKLISQSILKKSPENPDRRTDGRTDRRTDGRTDGHCHGIIRPFFKRAYKNAYEIVVYQNGGYLVQGKWLKIPVTWDPLVSSEEPISLTLWVARITAINLLLLIAFVSHHPAKITTPLSQLVTNYTPGITWSVVHITKSFSVQSTALYGPYHKGQQWSTSTYCLCDAYVFISQWHWLWFTLNQSIILISREQFESQFHTL